MLVRNKLNYKETEFHKAESKFLHKTRLCQHLSNNNEYKEKELTGKMFNMVHVRAATLQLYNPEDPCNK